MLGIQWRHLYEKSLEKVFKERILSFYEKSNLYSAMMNVVGLMNLWLSSADGHLLWARINDLPNCHKYKVIILLLGELIEEYIVVIILKTIPKVENLLIFLVKSTKKLCLNSTIKFNSKIIVIFICKCNFCFDYIFIYWYQSFEIPFIGIEFRFTTILM